MDIERLKIDAAVTAMNKMLKDKHFSICTVTDVAKLLGIHCRKESYDILNTLHCVNYSDMSPQMRKAIPALIADALGEPPAFQFNQPPVINVITIDVVDVEYTEVQEVKPKSRLMRLLGS